MNYIELAYLAQAMCNVILCNMRNMLQKL